MSEHTRADGVEYFEITGVPGLYFRCDRLHLKQPASDCAAMWRSARRDKDGRRSACRNCPVGAAHAGEGQAQLSSIRGRKVCARCGSGATRLIRGHLCVSCQNREYEVLKGRNSKGTRPIHAKVLTPRTMRYLHGNEIRKLHLPLSASLSELLIAAIRDSQDRVSFFDDGRIAAEALGISLAASLGDEPHDEQPPAPALVPQRDSALAADLERLRAIEDSMPSAVVSKSETPGCRLLAALNGRTLAAAVQIGIKMLPGGDPSQFRLEADPAIS